MAGVADSAVGAILEIPTTALRNIKKAEAAIWALHDASKKAADQIYGDFATRMPRGIDAFINKLAEAKKAMDGLGTINVTLNTQAAVSNAEQLSTTTQRTATDVSRAVQEMSQSWESLAGKAPKGIEFISFDAIQKTEDALKRLKTARDNVATSEGGRGAITEFAEGFTLSRQELSNLIAYLEKYIKLWKESATAKAEALSKVQSATDRDILSEQNKLLEDRLKWQKKINELQSTETTRMAKKGVGLNADETQQLTDYGNKITEVNAKLVALGDRYGQLSKKGQEAWQTNQIDNIIRKQEANIALTDKEAEALDRIKKAKDRIAETKQNKTDKEYLDEQKRLLTNILDLRKQINAQATVIAKGKITGASNLEEEKKIMMDLVSRYKEARQALSDYNAQKASGISPSAKDKAKINTLNQENALIKEQLAFRNKINTAIQTGGEYASQAQASKAHISNTDEGRAQRQLNSDYKAMINILRKVGEIKAKVAEQGRGENQNELNLITLLRERYAVYKDDINRVSGAFVNLSEARRKAFEADKSEQLARNAIMLADAQNKAMQAEERAIAAADRKIAQKEAQIAKQEAAEQKAAQDYEKWWLSALGKVEAERAKNDEARNAQRKKQAEQDAARIANARANAEKEVNDILNKRIDLQQKITALNTKQKIAALSDPNAKLNFSDSANLAKYERQMQSLKDRLNEIRTGYPKLARDSDRAFNTQKADLLALSLQKINEEYTKIASGKSTATRDSVEENLNRLYTERLKLLKEQEQLTNKILLRGASGGRDTATADENRLLTDINAKLKANKTEIDNVAQSYRALGILAAKAFDLNNLRQSIALTEKFDASLKRIDDANVRKLVSEYKSLIPTIQRLGEQMTAFRNANGDVNSASYQVMLSQLQSLVAREREIRMMSINEVEAYRQERANAAYQADLSAFVQNEAQKASIAKEFASRRAQDDINSRRNSYQYAMASYNQLMSGSGNSRDRLTDSYADREVVIKRLESAIKNLNKADSDYESKLNTLTTALNKLRTAQKEVTDVMKPPKPVVSPQDAITAAKNATTLKQLQDAYKQLQTAMANTDPKSQKWADMNSQLQKTKTQIDEIKKKMGEFRNESNRTSNTMSQLQSRIAAAFSIASITGFLKKMFEVRAQFELQRVALGAIIQDRDEANKIFTQVQQMALQSPFSIMQLERGTKQIAAFGFEAKKLVPTMKMFADISAGLGVEIDRLVLVMGHLKARNFLEGTMVRQFTNMGFNILGNLAKYYTELEGKMVSVGEVQERVKKKMISFEDVEEVLRRVTSAGGMFYDMQKKQSDSLWGQMQRIKDAYDLMLNEIGQANEGTIKYLLTLVRSLINNWRALKPWISSAVVAVGSYMAIATAMKFIPLLLTNIKTGFTAMGKAIGLVRTEQAALNATMMKNPYAAVASAILTIIVLITQWATSQSRLEETLERIESEGVGNMYDLIFQYRRLADTVKDTNKTYAERQKALEEIKRIYGDILPNQMLEIDNIRKMKDGYDDATEAIKAYYAEKIRHQKEEAVVAEYESKIKDSIKDAAERFSYGVYDDMASVMGFENLPFDKFKTGIESIMTAIAEEIKLGKIKPEQAAEEFKEALITSLGITDADYRKIDAEMQKMGGNLDRAFADVFNTAPNQNLLAFQNGVEETFRLMNDDLNEIKDLGSLNPFQEDEAQSVVEEYEALKKAVEEYKQALIALRDEQGKGNIEGNIKQSTSGALYADETKGLGQEALNSLNKAILNVQYAMQGFGMDFEVTADQVNGALQSEVDQMEYFDEINERTFGNALDNFNSFYSEMANKPFMQNLVEKWKEAKNELNMNEPQKKIAEFQHKIATEMGMSADIFKRFKLESIKSYDAARKKAKELSDESAENIKRIASTRIELIKLGMSAADAQREAERIHGNGKTEEEIKQEQKAYESLSRALGNYDKSKSGKSQDKELKRWQDLKKAIEDVTTQYDKLRKSYDVTESNKRIEELFGATFKELGADIHDFYKNGKYDANELIKALEVLKGMTKATTEERKKFRSEIERKIAGTEVEIDIKLREDSEKKLKADIDKMFDNYELTNELSKIGVNVDLTYMVGGKPTTLEDIRKEIERLKAEGGGNADAENRIKILEEAEKKITDIELKEQKERLKNYEKYLTKMYSDRAQKMISAYTTMSNMEEDFQSYIQKLMAEQSDAGTTDARKKQIAEEISMLQNQYAEAIRGVQRELNEAMAKADWNAFKGSDIFEQMYQDLSSLSKKGIDALIVRLEEMRDKLQSVSDIDPKAVREVTQYIEKLKNAKLDFAPFAGFRTALKEARDLKEEYGSIEASQLKLIELNDQTNAYTQQIDDLSTIIKLLDDGKEIKGKDAESTERLGKLYEANKDNLQGALELARENLKITQNDADELSRKINLAGKLDSAYEKQVSKLNAWKEKITSITNSVFDLVDAFGFDVDDEWKQLANTLIDATVQAIALQMQFEMLKVAAELFGVALNSALGIIGWISMALSAVVGIFSALFGQKDKRLKREIQKIQDRVDALSKSFKKLQKSIEQAFSIKKETDTTNQALNNLRQQKREYEQMIRLEKQKKKTDWSKVKEYEDKIEELAEAEQELYEKHHKKWGSTNDVWDEANNWVDAWLDAYKETGDGLDALNESWDEFYENLIKKQAVSKALGPLMDGYIKEINEALDRNMGSEYDYIDWFKDIRERIKADFQAANEELKKLFEYAGIGGGAGNLILSELQKGIPKITEPQAAAIEAYLNSMRFAVFEQNGKLDVLIATIQMQYGSGAENPVVSELKGIRGVLDNIYSTLRSVVKTNMGTTGIVIAR